MNHQVCTKKTTTTSIDAQRGDLSTKIMYAFYFTYMILLTVLESSHGLMTSVLGIVWLKKTLFIANIIAILMCVYLVIRNKKKAMWIMAHLPAWLLRLIDRIPDWMGRFLNHTFMRIMMVSCDVMLIWMCVGFGLKAVTQFGW